MDHTEPEVFNQPSISNNLSRKMKTKSRSPNTSLSKSIEENDEDVKVQAKKVSVGNKRNLNRRKVEEMIEK